jgi:LSD1 subclass zinc finger protein
MREGANAPGVPASQRATKVMAVPLVLSHAPAAAPAPAGEVETMPCSGCAVVLNVPEGAARFRCPQCAAVNATAAAEAAARGDVQGKIRRVDPKFASGPSSQKQFD